MYFFNRLSTATTPEEQLIPHYKRRLAWKNWHTLLTSKYHSYNDPENRSSLWLNQAGLTHERLNSLADIHTQLLTPEAGQLVQQRIEEALQQTQGNIEQLIKQWNNEVAQLKKECADLEAALHQAVSSSARLLGGVAHTLSTQPSYAFASSCFTELALSARTDPQLAAYLTLDDVYLGFFKNISGSLLLTLEIGLYFYFNLLSACSMMFINAFFAHATVRESIYRFSEQYLPGREFSILTGLKGNVSLLSSVFFFALQCGSDSLTSQAWMKWGILAIVAFMFERMSSNVSTMAGNAMMRQGRPHHAFLVHSVIHHTLLLCAWIYMYPWLLQHLDTELWAGKTSTTALETLGLKDDANPTEIRKRVKSLLLQYHPDHNADPAAREMTQKILEAANALKEIKHVQRAP